MSMKNSTEAGKKTRKPGRKKKLTQEQMKNLFEAMLHQRYWAEKELVLLLPKLIKRATSYELVSALEQHLAISEEQIIRLIHVFDALEERATASRAVEMDPMLVESEKIIDSRDTGYTADAAIIQICQQLMEHEIESYTTLVSYAETLEETDAASYLKTAVLEEESAHTTLTQIALSAIYFDQAG